MTVELLAVIEATRVTLTFANRPPTVSVADNNLGTRQSLAKLAALLEH